MKSFRHVILICEDSWEGTRSFALLLSQKGIPVSVIVKGDPGREVIQMISPKSGVRNYFFKRLCYRIFLFPLLGWLFLKNRWDVLCVTKERTYRQLERLRCLISFDLYHFNDCGKESFLVSHKGQKIPFTVFLLES